MSPKRSTTYGRILSLRSERKRTLLVCSFAVFVFVAAVQAMPAAQALVIRPAAYSVSLEVGQKSKIAIESAGTGKIAAPGRVGRKATHKKHADKPKPVEEAPPAPESTAIVLSSAESEETAVSGEASSMPAFTEEVGTGSAGAEMPAVAGGGGGGGAAGGESKGEIDIGKPRPRSWMWNCNWPLFASTKDATVNVRITVNKKGQAERVEVIDATHREFISDARECAMNSNYHPAKNSLGETVAAVSDVWPIHFIRAESGTF